MSSIMRNSTIFDLCPLHFFFLFCISIAKRKPSLTKSALQVKTHILPSLHLILANSMHPPWYNWFLRRQPTQVDKISSCFPRPLNASDHFPCWNRLPPPLPPTIFSDICSMKCSCYRDPSSFSFCPEVPHIPFNQTLWGKQPCATVKSLNRKCNGVFSNIARHLISK